MKKGFNEEVLPLIKKFRNLIYKELRKGGQSGKEKWGPIEPTEEIIEDISQETALEAWKKYPKFDPSKASLSTWVGWIIRGRVLNWKKYNSRRPQVNIEDYSEFSNYEQPDSEVEIEQSISSLSQKEQSLLDLHIGGYSNEEIALILNSTKHSIDQQLTNLKSKMHDSRGNQ